jgi:hypothetical protein
MPKYFDKKLRENWRKKNWKVYINSIGILTKDNAHEKYNN